MTWEVIIAVVYVSSILFFMYDDHVLRKRASELQETIDVLQEDVTAYIEKNARLQDKLIKSGNLCANLQKRIQELEEVCEDNKKDLAMAEETIKEQKGKLDMIAGIEEIRRNRMAISNSIAMEDIERAKKMCETPIPSYSESTIKGIEDVQEPVKKQHQCHNQPRDNKGKFLPKC